MSDFSKALHSIGDFFEKLFANNPTVQTDVANLKAAAANLEAQAPTIAVDAANAALAFIPGGFGVLAQPLVDSLLEAIATKILGKHSNPAVGAQSVAAAIQTPTATAQPAAT